VGRETLDKSSKQLRSHADRTAQWSLETYAEKHRRGVATEGHLLEGVCKGNGGVWGGRSIPIEKDRRGKSNKSKRALVRRVTMPTGEKKMKEGKIAEECILRNF